MRVRTAVVVPTKADAIKAIFKLANDRHLAWIIGTGRQYVDLESRAHSHGYQFWTAPGTEEEPSKFWIAVREDLISETVGTEGESFIEFNTIYEGLGTIRIGSGQDLQLQDDQALVFDLGESDGGDVVTAIDENGRVDNPRPRHAGETPHDFHYTEYLYTIKQLELES